MQKHECALGLWLEIRVENIESCIPLGTLGKIQSSCISEGTCCLQQCPVTQLWKCLFLVVYFLHFIRLIFSLLPSLFSLDSSVFVRNDVTIQQWYWHDMAEFLFSRRTEFLKPSVCQLFALLFRSSGNVASHLKLKQQS